MKRIRTFVDKDVYDRIIAYAEENYIKAENGRANFGKALRKYLKFDQ